MIELIIIMVAIGSLALGCLIGIKMKPYPVKRRKNRIKKSPEEVDVGWSKALRKLGEKTTAIEINHLRSKGIDIDTSIGTLLETIEGEIGLCEEPMEYSYEQIIYSIKALVEQFRRENNL